MLAYKHLLISTKHKVQVRLRLIGLSLIWHKEYLVIIKVLILTLGWRERKNEGIREAPTIDPQDDINFTAIHPLAGKTFEHSKSLCAHIIHLLIWGAIFYVCVALK